MKAAATFLLVLSYLSNCHGWTCKAGPQHPSAVQIDAGEGQVVMTDKFLKVFLLNGSSWSNLGSVPLQHATVGLHGIWGDMTGGVYFEVWGTNPSNQVYKYVGGNFIPVPGQNLKQVDAGGSVQIVGTSTTNLVYCLNSSSASSNKQPGPVTWNNIDGQLKYVSCGPNACWGVNSAGQIFVTQDTPTNCAISGWIQVSGAAIKVEVATDGSVFVVNSNGQVYQRVGITQSNPQGTNWVQIPISQPVISASYDLGRLWVVTDKGIILVCTH